METRSEALRRGLNETLDSVLSSAVRDALLVEALSQTTNSELPTDPDALSQFLFGPLRQALARALGHELGAAVAEELGRRMGSLPPERATAREGKIESDMRAVGGSRQSHALSEDPAETPGAPSAQPGALRRHPNQTPTQPDQPAVVVSGPASGDFPSGTARVLGIGSAESSAPPERLPMLFLATQDAELVRRFMAWLDPSAVVVKVSRLIDLLLDLEDIGTRRTVIVFDLRQPPFRPEALAAIAEELPTESRVLLWGGSRQNQFDLTVISPRVTRWIACPEGMPFSTAMDRCSQLVG